ncbi:PIN domain-containing protein [Desulfocastanea catecholica]
MEQKLLLVDFENVQQIDLSQVEKNSTVKIFVGSSQKSIPIDLVTSAQKLGSRIEWERVDGNGSNALDFHIACHLGRVLEKSPQIHCTVLSKDKGFDPLLRHLNRAGLKCKRINSLIELDPKSTPKEDPNYNRAFEILGKIEKKKRPRKLTTLTVYISSIFQKKISASDIDRIIDLLFARKMISETKDTISYNF